MGKSGKVSLIACACYVAAYIFTYVFVGSLDSAFDAATAVNAVARHDAERTLSIAFDAFVVLGLISLWLYGVSSWLGGSAVGVLTAFSAGGFHVMGCMGEWLPIALCMGFAGGSVFLLLARRNPSACTLLAVEISLAALQALFIFVS